MGSRKLAGVGHLDHCCHVLAGNGVERATGFEPATSSLGS